MTAPRTKPKPAGIDRPITLKVIKLMAQLHTRLYRLTGGRLGKKWRIGSAVRKGVPICLLTTTGRKSGELRTVPLCYLSDGDRIVLVASQGGTPTNPQWYYNVRANPAVEIRIGRVDRSMTARVAGSDERAELWPRLVELYADFASYQTWTEREIPVVVCEPVVG
jgi:deazaflavin-dependent oxidoreductase (nitroreductase family)